MVCRGYVHWAGDRSSACSLRPICPPGSHPPPEPGVEPEDSSTDDQAPQLPRQIRRSLVIVAGLAAAGLMIFLVGFVIGAREEGPTPSVVAAAVVVVVVVIVTITWVLRMRGP